MPAELAVDRFLSLLERSGIVPQDKMQRLLEEFGEEDSGLDSSQKIADELVAREVLTPWQAHMLLQGKHRGFILGPYRILKPLGRGGMGAVYLAEHQMMRRRCAIKVLPSNYDRESSVLDRFYREAQAVAALDHPNIVRAYDVNKCLQNKTEIHYLVMEYIEGQDLQKMVEEQEVLGYRQAAEYMRQAAEGLAHAHQAGFVHRDIKPANLLVDPNGVVKILDLGLARFFGDTMDASLTKELGETVLGTADYLAPEQALDSHDVDARADIYSLGQTFYFLLRGRPPFPDGTVAQRLMAHQMKTPEPIINTRPDAPPSLLAIIDKMTAKKRELRYQSAQEVADELKVWMEGHSEDSGFLRRASRLAARSAPPVKSSAEPTHPRASALDETETELELAPLDDDQDKKKPSSGTKLDAPTSGSGVQRGSKASGGSGGGVGAVKPKKAPPKQPADSAPADDSHAAEPPAQSPKLPVDLESLSTLQSGPAASPLDAAVAPAPLSASGAFKTASSSGVRRKKPGARHGRASEKGALGRAMDSPWFWITLAGVFVVALLIAILASRPQPAEFTVGTGPAARPAPEERREAEPSTDGQAAPEESAAEAGAMAEAEPIAEAEAEPREPSGGGAEGGRQASEPGPKPESGRPTERAAVAGPQPKEQRAPTEGGGRREPASDPRPEPAPAEAGSEVGRLSRSGETEPSRPGVGGPVEEPSPKERPEPAQPDKDALFAGLERISCNFETPAKKMDPKILLMIRQQLERVLDRMDVIPAQNAPAVLTVTFTPSTDEGFIVFMMSARLVQQFGESDELELWQHELEVGRFRGGINLTLLRNSVGDFFDKLDNDFREAQGEGAER